MALALAAAALGSVSSHSLSHSHSLSSSSACPSLLKRLSHSLSASFSASASSSASSSNSSSTSASSSACAATDVLVSDASCSVETTTNKSSSFSSTFARRPSYATSFQRRKDACASSPSSKSGIGRNRKKSHARSSPVSISTSLTKVITDIDDTVVSSGGMKLFGIKLGGIDNRYRRGQFYPGVIQFALELSRPLEPILKLRKRYNQVERLPKPVSDEAASLGPEAKLPDRVAVLTARAKEFKFALALKTGGKLCKAYDAVGKLNGLKDWGIGDVYYGSVAEWILHNRKGLRKFKNFEIMMKHDDELLAALSSTTNNNNIPHTDGGRQYILIGDTGEKDEEAGELMALNYPSRVKAIFLHSVHALRPKRGETMHDIPINVPIDRKLNGVPIFYFRTYVGAAIKAYQNKFITKEGVIRVAETAVKDLVTIDKSLRTQGLLNRLRKRRIEELQSLRWKELKADIDCVDFLRNVLDN